MPKARQKISQLPSSHRNFVSYIHSDDVTSPSQLDDWMMMIYDEMPGREE
jgi:hypothetical protein